MGDMLGCPLVLWSTCLTVVLLTSSSKAAGPSFRRGSVGGHRCRMRTFTGKVNQREFKEISLDFQAVILLLSRLVFAFRVLIHYMAALASSRTGSLDVLYCPDYMH